MAEKAIMIKKDTLWKIGTAVFAVLFVISLFTGGFGISGGAITNGGGNGEFSLEEMCSSIRGTPAWGDSEGNIIDYGYKEDYVVDDLIENKMYFLYNPGCGWCQKQIEFFGEEWQKYVNSGYTVNCKEVLGF